MMERNTSSPDDSEHTTVGGRFIAGFAVTGLALALVVSTWSIRAADPKEVSDQQNSTVNAQTTSTSAERPTTEPSTSTSKSTSQRSEDKTPDQDPFLPPHAWEEDDYQITGQSQQPTAMWLAEPGKAPERRTFKNNPSGQQSVQQPSVQPRPQPQQVQPQPTSADSPQTTAQQPLDKWSDITTWLPTFPEQPNETKNSEPTTGNSSTENPDPTGENPSDGNSGEPTPLDPTPDNNPDNGTSEDTQPDEIIPDSGNFIDNLTEKFPGKNATGAQ